MIFVAFFSRTFYDFLMKKKGSYRKKKKRKLNNFFQINTKKNLTNDNQIQFIGYWPTV